MDADGPDHVLDFARAARRGYPEAVYCEGKSPAQVEAIARAVLARAQAASASEAEIAAFESSQSDVQPNVQSDVADRCPTSVVGATSGTGSGPGPTAALGAAAVHGIPCTLFTRASAEHAAAVKRVLPDAFHDEVARLLAWPPVRPQPTGGLVVVVCAGTSDLPVAREALLTARHLGREATLVADVGVAGLHRVLAQVDLLRSARAIVVVAGMDGALPAVVAGLVSAPVVAVPTSVGYGASFGGIAALLSMLNACAPGIGVVNIDNGYGGGHLAAQIAADRR
ncbi:MAG TPA: nickel pincer cofactor biosynthesis protein LarB [Dermatophilaceae bacterium]|jgi:NCAIR mutase (PurE)-related protein|nr:nickel pincer cofactor biosynthesis protein LarB [Dermatophilaceae bacterium]HMT88497.1 nickel pincer cofactor biosynthesis protein LarB [Dermatophilaceae bacterium]